MSIKEKTFKDIEEVKAELKKGFIDPIILYIEKKKILFQILTNI